METEEELNVKILEITMLIQKRHSELSKFLDEMPVTIPNENNPQINIKILKDYYESLNKMLEHSSPNLPSHPRPDANRSLDGAMLNFDLPTIIERIKQEAEWIAGKHNAITLMKSDKMRIVLIAMHKGNEMKAHRAEGAISVHIISGELKFVTENETTLLHKNQLLTLHENIKHSVIAMEETIFLLTMVHEKSISA